LQISIKGTRYKLVFKKLHEAHGLCNTEKKIIYIDSSKNTPESLLRWTLCHELFHAYLNEMHISDIISSDLEVILCEVVSEMIDKNIDLIGNFHGPN
jgi:Zn-dependent peptidase ImmA (M78 family)